MKPIQDLIRDRDACYQIFQSVTGTKIIKDRVAAMQDGQGVVIMAMPPRHDLKVFLSSTGNVTFETAEGCQPLSCSVFELVNIINQLGYGPDITMPPSAFEKINVKLDLLIARGLMENFDGTVTASTMHDASKSVLTFQEACEYTGLSKSYLYKLTAKREVPHFKPRDKMLYFNREELEDWMQRGRVATNEEVEMIANESLRRMSRR